MQFTSSDERLILETLAERRRSFRIGGIALAVVGACIAAGAFFGLDEPGRNLWMFGAAMVPAGLLVAVVFAGAPKKDSPIIALLRDRPESVVWCYVHQNNSGGAITQILRFGCDDGKLVNLVLTPATAEALVSRIRALLPTATHGYSPDLQAAFQRSPGSLRRT